MILKGIDVDTYFTSHSAQEVHTVLNALEAFGLHRELELYIKNSLYKKKYVFRKAQEAAISGRDEEVHAWRMESRMKPIKARCPQCRSTMRGTHDVACAGRTWYEECDNCTYYREEFGG